MPQNFIACDRGQTMLMPPDLLDWVPDDHVVWSILGAVEQMDLGDFYGAYRENGQGQAAYEPSMMVALLLYAYARGNRSSRGTERECGEDGLFGRDRGDELPEHLRTEEGRRAAFKAAKERLAQKKGRGEEPQVAQFDLDPEQFTTRGWGRRAWHREGRKALLRQREHDA